MSREIPEPVRAAAGLAATVLDEVRKLPESLPGLPVRAVGLAMQAALKLQQEYAGLVARGDELFTGVRGENEPGMATFDDEDDEPVAPAASGYRESAFDRAEAPAPDADVTTAPVIGLDEIAEADGATWTEALEEDALEELAIEELVDAEPTPEVDGDTAPVPAPPVSKPQAPPTAPIEGYDSFSIAQLRGRLRGYAPTTVEQLLDYEQANRAREPYVRMLRNRLERVTAQEVEASPLAPRGT
jgi:hypothetical protein